MFQLWGLLRRNYQATLNPPVANKSTEPLRFGILGAAVIAPIALILPAKSHPEVVVQAVAARDNAFKHSIPDVKPITRRYSLTQRLIGFTFLFPMDLILNRH
ncbi:hypothetical protein V2G26_010885 [Clonostachys chloroleuca]